jgi:adenine-specific DNA-methyltransferase
MRYIGGKSLILDKILQTIEENTTDVKKIIDAFSGSGICATTFKEKGFSTISNDFLYFSYVLNRGTIDLNLEPSFLGLGFDPIEYLNNLTLEQAEIDLKDCFIYQNYSLHDDCQRMYFQEKNAIKIDIIRITIENWKTNNKITEDEYFYLLSCLINAVPYVSNITGVYGAYLKAWDIRTYNDLVLKKPSIIGGSPCTSYNLKINDLLEIEEADLLYADPPYNSRQYLPNYHVLETIAKYDNPSIKGVTGMRDYSNQKSDFCIKAKVSTAFEELISKAKVRYVLISYNNESLLSTEELSNICKKYAKENTFKLIEFNYRRYKSHDVADKAVCEQLYFFEKV